MMSTRRAYQAMLITMIRPTSKVTARHSLYCTLASWHLQFRSRRSRSCEQEEAEESGGVHPEANPMLGDLNCGNLGSVMLWGL